MVATLLLSGAPVLGADLPVPSDVHAADLLVGQPGSKARDKALGKWAERASLSEIVWVLRRSSSELGTAEVVLASAGLSKAAEPRVALRRRLTVRARVADPKAKLPRGAVIDPGVVPHLRASVFRTAIILPDTGDYGAYGQSVRSGFEAGLRDSAAPFRIELRSLASGDGDASRILAAFDSVADDVGSVAGELLSVPTLVLATASRYAGVPLVSPTAPDETVGRVSPAVFQIGPSGHARGEALARAVLAEARRVGVLTSSAVDGGSFARGFAAAAESLGSPVVWNATYSPGSVNFKDEARDLTAKRVEVLFWDGDPREADALIRQLARDRISVRICGGEPLAPTQHHSDSQLLYEGVQYVAEEWTLPDSAQARLDGAPAASGEERHAGSLETRGFLAGRAIAAAVRSGALCPEEIADHLAARRSKSKGPREQGFIDLAADGVVLPIYTVSRGRAVPLGK